MNERVESLLEQILLEMRKSNQLQMELIAALGEDEPDPDAEPVRYIDGSPVHG